jgi:hypothetical protein
MLYQTVTMYRHAIYKNQGLLMQPPSVFKAAAQPSNLGLILYYHRQARFLIAILACISIDWPMTYTLGRLSSTKDLRKMLEHYEINIGSFADYPSPPTPVAVQITPTPRVESPRIRLVDHPAGDSVRFPSIVEAVLQTCQSRVRLRASTTCLLSRRYLPPLRLTESIPFLRPWVQNQRVSST